MSDLFLSPKEAASCTLFVVLLLLGIGALVGLVLGSTM
jgi:hypothetical protein